MNAKTNRRAEGAAERAERRLLRERRIPIWCMAGLLAGCLDDPPTFAPRGQIPPFIIASQVDPPLGSIYEGPLPIPIDVPFRSEDVNIPVEARAYLDLVPGSSDPPRPLESVLIPPGNFEETRFAGIEWTQTLAGACHSLTLILTHIDNYALNGLPLDDARAARIVWWTNVGDTNEQVLMADCPRASQNDAVPGGQ